VTAKKTPRSDSTRVSEDAAEEQPVPLDAEAIPTGKEPASPAPEQVAEAAEAADAVAEDAASDLATRLEEVQARADEYLDSLQRERATFQNYKKRVERERNAQAQAIAGNLLLKLLPTLDDFHRAIEAVPEDARDQWFEGMELILRKLERFLSDEGVTEIDALGKPFDPAYHEAVGVDQDTDAESGTITQVLQRGYMHGERVLRPAMVRVAE